MSFLLCGLIALLLVGNVLGDDFSIGLGLSPKNVMLYMIGIAIALRSILKGGFKIEITHIVLCFAFLIAYTTASLLITGWLVRYESYDMAESLIRLKGSFFDYAAFLLVFFYGTTSESDTLRVLRFILCSTAIASILSALHGAGIIQIASVEDHVHSARLLGLMGEANSEGAFNAVFLPCYVAAAITGRGAARLLWSVAALAALGAMLMTASRGAFVAVAMSLIVGGWLFRRYLSAPVVLAWLVGGLLAVIVVFLLLDPNYQQYLMERVLGQSLSPDSSEASSGRIEFWSNAIGRMLGAPASLLIGFGWNAYDSFPFRFAPHNAYLKYWFELGLPGVVTFVAILILMIRYTMRSALLAVPAQRAHLIAFSASIVTMGTALFFVELDRPMPYFWACAGVTLRLAMLVTAKHRAAQQDTRLSRAPAGARSRRTDAFGWVATPVQKRTAQNPVHRRT